MTIAPAQNLHSGRECLVEQGYALQIDLSDMFSERHFRASRINQLRMGVAWQRAWRRTVCSLGKASTLKNFVEGESKYTDNRWGVDD